MIIAEIGQNYCGDIGLATKLIGLAKDNGADLVKFQLFASKVPYDEYLPVELSKELASHLFNYGKAIGIEVFFSVFDVERVQWCEEMGVKIYKIASSAWNNMVLLGALGGTGKKLIASIPYGNCKIPSILNGCLLKTLYCIPEYPAKLQSLAFGFMLRDYDGFSDHTIGLDASKIAIARGAEIIEKHFAIDHKTGIDAPWSMDAEELKELKRWESVCKEVL